MWAEFSAIQRTVTDPEVVGGDATGMQVWPFIHGLGVCFLAPPDMASVRVDRLVVGCCCIV